MAAQREFKNKKAYFEYHILEKVEAGIVLIGSEVKSIRDGNLNLSDSYARLDGGQLPRGVSPFFPGAFFEKVSHQLR